MGVGGFGAGRGSALDTANRLERKLICSAVLGVRSSCWSAGDGFGGNADGVGIVVTIVRGGGGGVLPGA